MKERKTGNLRPDDPSVDSYDTAKDAGWNGLSFLSGATVNGGTNDMGCDRDYPFGLYAGPDPGWEESYRRTRNLRRHTVDQGLSTFSWPKKK